MRKESNEEAWAQKKAAAQGYTVVLQGGLPCDQSNRSELLHFASHSSSSLLSIGCAYLCSKHRTTSEYNRSHYTSHDKFQIGPGYKTAKFRAFLARYEIRPGEGPIVVRLADGEENSLALQSKSTISFSVVRTTEDNRGQQRTAEYYFCAWISPKSAILKGPRAWKGLKVRDLCQGQKGGGRGGDRSRPYWRGAVLWCQDLSRLCCVERPFTCVWWCARSDVLDDFAPWVLSRPWSRPRNTSFGFFLVTGEQTLTFWNF